MKPRLVKGRLRHIQRVVQVALAAAFLAAVLASCRTGGIQEGHAFAQIDGVGLGNSTPSRLGDKLGYLFVYLRNASKEPLTIDSVGFLGSGVGKVVRPVQEKIAPIGPGAPRFVGGGFYATDPPVRSTSRGCLVEVLKPLRSYRMAPGGQAVIWVVFKAVGVGGYDVSAHEVYYSQAGIRYRQATAQGYRGSVARDGARNVPGPSEKPCLGETTPLDP